MTTAAGEGTAADLSNALVAAVFAVDPVGFGGVALRSGAGPVRERWLDLLAALLPTDVPWRRVPLHINEDRLLGGLDLSATLQAGRPVAQRGLLAEADGSIVVLAMAERLSRSTAASVAAVIDTRELVAERHGIGTRSASRIGVVALDEGIADDEQLPSRLSERMAFRVTLPAAMKAHQDGEAPYTRADVAAARSRYAAVRIDDEFVAGLCSAALALGVDSVRTSMHACRAARALAALDGRDAVAQQDAALAAGLVLAPCATRAPAASAAPEETDAPAQPGAEAEVDPPAAPGEAEPSPLEAEPIDTTEPTQGAVDDVVLAAALAVLPPAMLAALALGVAQRGRSLSAGRAGAAQLGKTRGRPTGVRRGEPQGGARLNLIETLRAAAPWQTLRRREAAASGHSATARIQVRREDFHVWRFKQRSETTTVFVVDASGSAALHRLAETKGAVELLLADCYVRRDSVAVIAFRGAGAELLLPPTRSLVRAKRGLAGLPGGGGTPLAAGIALAHTLAESVRRRGATPIVVLLTDGRANIARDGSPGRARATDDALAAARQLRIADFPVLLLDTAPQPQQVARDLAAALGARYLPLPHAGAATLSQAVLAARGPTS